MPKNEFDFEDPLELNGMALLTAEDTTHEMAETFIEEFMRMGYGPSQILALFRNPHYLGPHLACEKRGEPFIRERITAIFARWGRRATWADASAAPDPQPPGFRPEHPAEDAPGLADASEATESDPLGAAIPRLNL